MPVCPNCQAGIAAAARFCPNCGCRQIVAQTDSSGEDTLWSEAERRNLAILFCDVVGSTALSTRLDPEDLGQAFGRVQDCCQHSADAQAGYVAEYLGDGVVAYFGYPAARENPVEDAIRAALKIRDDVAALRIPGVGAISVRIGIAHGLVVVGDIAERGGSPRVVGETPNLAARLQAIAPAGTIAITDRARRRVGELFQTSDHGRHPIKGFDAPIHAWLVEGEALVENRFAALRSADRHEGAEPFIGRADELAVLENARLEALNGEGRLVAVVGEPGIGKSRLIETFCAGLPAGRRARLYGSERHQHSPLYPVLRHIERAARFAPEDDNAARADKLHALLEETLPAAEHEAAGALLGDLLRIQGLGDLTTVDPSPARRRQRTLTFLTEMLAQSAGAPGFMIVIEDAHWLDPTSQELLAIVAARIAEWRALAIVTSRQEIKALPSSGHIELGPLSPDEARQLIQFGQLPEAAAEQILARSEGVPLFLEEFSRAFNDRPGSDGESGQKEDRQLPGSLRDVLLTRLDALPTAKRVAQAASAFGPQFHAGVVARVAGIPSESVDTAIGQLEAADLIRAKANGGWEFRHALLREAAYELLLRRVRRRLHARIARLFIEEMADSEPETIAHHLQLGGANRTAATYWRTAGERALHRAAYAEAAHHLGQGIAALQADTETADTALELDLQSALGTALMQLKGFAAPDVEAAFARAEQFCGPGVQVGDAHRFHVLWGIWALRITRGQIADAGDLAARLAELAMTAGDPDLQVLADAAAVPSAYYAGAHEAALDACQSVRARYDADRHGTQALTYTVDAKTLALMFGALAAWAKGDAALHRDLDSELDAHLTALGLAFLKPYAACMQAMQRVLAGRPEDAIALASEAATIAGDLDLTFWQVVASLWHGAATIMNGAPEEGVAILESALGHYEMIGAVTVRPYLRALLAHGYRNLGRHEIATETAAMALSDMETRGERCHEPAIHALVGDLLEPSGKTRCEA